jgi:uncharacterized membrane protein YczE
VKSAPVLRGGPIARGVWLVSGLLLCAIGILCFLEAKLGLAPWDVLHQGIAKHTPLSFGLANEVVGVVVMGIGWRLGARIGIGTVANAVLIGGFIALIQGFHLLKPFDGQPLVTRIGMLAFGLVCFGVGTAFYIGANLGAGPRDSLMLVVSRRTGVRIGVARGGLELLVLVVGFLLGGKVGVGTLVFALGIGPSVELAFLGAMHSPIVARVMPRAPLAASLGN